jgi:hypothetical protein
MQLSLREKKESRQSKLGSSESTKPIRRRCCRLVVVVVVVVVVVIGHDHDHDHLDRIITHRIITTMPRPLIIGG